VSDQALCRHGLKGKGTWPGKDDEGSSKKGIFWQMMVSDFPLQIDRFTYIPFYSSMQNFSGFAWERILS
jgi:hypothetical protein